MSAKKYTDQELIQSLIEAASKKGGPPGKNEIKSYTGISHNTYQRRFGSWTKALSEAGIGKVRIGKSKVTKEDIIIYIKGLKEKIGRWPVSKDYADNKGFALDTILRKFKRLGDAYREIDPLYMSPYLASKESIVSDIQSVRNIINSTPTRSSYKKYGLYDPITLDNHFGSFSNALVTAGFEPTLGGANLKISEHELKSELIRIIDAGCDKLTINKLKEYGCKYSSNAYKRYGWSKILNELGLKQNKISNLTKEDMILALKRAEKELGRTPECRDLSELNFDMPSYATYINKFGSWNGALEAAGIDVVHARKERVNYNDPDGYKTCSSCEKRRDLNQFRIKNASADGLQPCCKSCQHISGKKYDTSSKGKSKRKEINQRENIKETKRNYQKTEAGKASQAKWNASPAGKASCKRSDQKRRALLKKAFVEHVDEQLLLDAQNHMCYYCGSDLKILPGPQSQLEHKIPISRGGLHCYANCVMSCQCCNLAKSTKTADEFMALDNYEDIMKANRHKNRQGVQ